MISDDLEPELPPVERPERLPDPFSFCNCGKKGCPGIRTVNGGADVAIDEAALDMVGLATERPAIVFTREQATELRRWLEQHGY